ncbi:hypothetical protein DENIS_1614 [Desulfonema ishimotonii]|uniref:Uncharacterized protein n=1 Tax=Desulfonema ishimotonii TaxID=45657 RepID=A0A401FUJ3_9BACT|nr:hypothetical protein [Desulfonema ishimotonii]GBC60657.1 hypothetical protein DENIS_1614 [Desulfonema ishimotonii]
MMFQPIDGTLDAFDPPHEIEEVVELLEIDLPFRDKVVMGSLTEADLDHVYMSMNQIVGKEFNLPGGNPKLLTSCREFAYENEYDLDDPIMIIVRSLWEKIRKTHSLKMVK